MAAVTLAVELLLMNCIGIFIYKSGVANSDFVSRLTNFVMKFCIPCLIFNSISSATAFSIEALANCAVVVVLGAAAILLSLGLGQIGCLLTGGNGVGRILRYGLTFCHFSFMGIPMIEALLGEMGTFYYSFFLLPVRVAYYALSEPLMTPKELRGGKMNLKKTLHDTVLNPCMIAVAAGVVFWIAGWHLPTAVNYCVKTMSAISSPLALLLCGMIIAQYDFRQLLRPKYLFVPLLRAVLMPAVFFTAARLLRRMGVDGLICDMLVIYSALPVGSLLPVYAVRYDPDPENHLTAAAASMISVLLSAVTLPVCYMLL